MILFCWVLSCATVTNVMCSAFIRSICKYAGVGGGNLFFFWRWGKEGREKLFCKLWFWWGWSGLQMCFYRCGGLFSLFFIQHHKNLTLHRKNITPQRKNIIPHHKNIIPHRANIKQQYKNITPQCKNITPHRSNIKPQSKKIKLHRKNVTLHQNFILCINWLQKIESYLFFCIRLIN